MSLTVLSTPSRLPVYQMSLLKIQQNQIKTLREHASNSREESPLDYELLPISRLTRKTKKRVLRSSYAYDFHERPKTRSECEMNNPDAIRPCPYVGCKFHTYLSVSEVDGRIDVNYPDLHPWELAYRSPSAIEALTVDERKSITYTEGKGALLPSCVLDVVDDLGGTTLEQCGLFVDRTRERIRQIELMAGEALKSAIDGEGLVREDL